MRSADEQIDLESAIGKANLTERQHTILMLWLIGHTQEEIAIMVGLKQPAVSRQISRTTKVISEFM